MSHSRDFATSLGKPDCRNTFRSLHSLSFEMLVALCEQKLFGAPKILILCFWHQYLICSFLRMITKKKTCFLAPVAFLVSFVLLSAYCFPWATTEESLEISTNFWWNKQQLEPGWQWDCNSAYTKANAYFVYSSYCINRLQSQQQKVCSEVWSTVFCWYQSYNKVMFFSSLITEKSFNVFCPLDFCDMRSWCFCVVCYILLL